MSSVMSNEEKKRLAYERQTAVRNVWKENAARNLLSALIIAYIRLGKDDLEFKQKYFNNQALKKYLDMVTPKKIHKLLSIAPFNDLYN